MNNGYQSMILESNNDHFKLRFKYECAKANRNWWLTIQKYHRFGFL